MSPHPAPNTVAPSRPRARAGASLLQVAGYLGAASLLIFGAAALFGTASSAATANELTDQLAQMRAALRQYAFARPDAPASNALIARLGALPAGVVQITDPASGALLLGTAGGTTLALGGSAQAPTFSIAALTVPACTALLRALEVGGQPVARVEVADSGSGPAAALAWPLPATAMERACAAGPGARKTVRIGT